VTPAPLLCATFATTVPDSAGSLVYIDTSAVVKLVFAEVESAALRTWLSRSTSALVSSALLEVELARAMVRARSQGAGSVADSAVRSLLDAIDLVDLDRDQLKVASELSDPYLRALDAIHLAAALSIRDRIGAVLTYDVRMTQAAQARSFSVIAPS